MDKFIAVKIIVVMDEEQYRDAQWIENLIEKIGGVEVLDLSSSSHETFKEAWIGLGESWE